MWAMKCRSWSVCVCEFNVRAFALSVRAEAFHSIHAHRAVVQGHTNVWLSGKFSPMVKMMSSDVDTKHMPKMHIASLPIKVIGQHLKRRDGCLNEPVSLSSSQDNGVLYNSTTVFPMLWLNSHCCLLSKEGCKNVSLLIFECESPELHACLHMFPVYSIFTACALY